MLPSSKEKEVSDGWVLSWTVPVGDWLLEDALVKSGDGETVSECGGMRLGLCVVEPKLGL